MAEVQQRPDGAVYFTTDAGVAARVSDVAFGPPLAKPGQRRVFPPSRR